MVAKSMFYVSYKFNCRTRLKDHGWWQWRVCVKEVETVQDEDVIVADRSLIGGDVCDVMSGYMWVVLHVEHEISLKYGHQRVQANQHLPVFLTDTMLWASLSALGFFGNYALYKSTFLPARCYASAGNSDRNVSVRPSVCLSVRPSHAGIVSKRRKLAAWFLHHLVAPRL